MRLIKGSDPGPDEPEDGWVAAPPLHDNIHITLTLCQFTGAPPEAGICTFRQTRTHPDVDCLAVYILGQRVLDMGVRDLAGLLSDPPPNLTRPSIWPNI